MDQQNPKRPAPTPEEIARLEAEAVRAMLRGEPIPRRAPEDGAPEAAPAEPAQPAQRPDFVPYVDDVEPEPAPQQPEPEQESEEAYVPGKWEQRIDAMSPQQWKRTQIIGGAALGAVIVALLFLGNDSELSTYWMILAAGIALLLPRYLERTLRHKLNLARKVMVIAMVIGLIAYLVIGITGGRFSRKDATPQPAGTEATQEAEAADPQAQPAGEAEATDAEPDAEPAEAADATDTDAEAAPEADTTDAADADADAQPADDADATDTDAEAAPEADATDAA